MCKGRECTVEKCASDHPCQSKDIKKSDIEKIASFFKLNKYGYLSEYHFHRLNLSEAEKSVMGGAEGITSSKTD